jgi:Spy/CpxP family protein refolding chaperone
MKKVLTLAVIFFSVWSANAQVTDNSGKMNDSSRHRFMHRGWNQNGRDSMHRNFGRFRGESLSRVDLHNRRNRFHSFDRTKSRSVFAKYLHTTPEQRKQMHDINEDYRKKSQDLYRQDNLTLREYKLRLLALQKDKKSKLENLLTSEQKNMIETRKKHRAEELQVNAAARLERMKIRLNLSEDQASKIKMQQTDFRMQMIAIHDNDGLLHYQKRDQMKDLMVKREESFKSLLTPEQFSQFEKMHKQRFNERFQRINMN